MMHRFLRRSLGLLGLLVLLWSAPGAGPSAAAPSPSEQAAGAGTGAVNWHALLVAGSNAQHVFDNARLAMRDRLLAIGIPKNNIQMLSADGSRLRGGVRAATLANIEAALHGMADGADSGCLVFMTSHGSERGLDLSYRHEALTQQTLDRLLTRSCGNVPTVVIMSGCHTGIFVDSVMRRPNRIILTAARHDRTSFGCSNDVKYTYYDECLLDTLPRARLWQDLSGMVNACVEGREEAIGAAPSLPQGFFGSRVTDMPLPAGRH